MKRFKSIILPMQGHSKSSLHWLYNTASAQEPPLIFQYGDFHFWFSGTGHCSSEKLLLYVSIPGSYLGRDFHDESSPADIPAATFLLNLLSPVLNELSTSYQNLDKNVREKAQFEAQSAGCTMTRRNGISYRKEEDAFILRIHFNVPLLNAVSVNAKSAVAAVRDILDHIRDTLSDFNPAELQNYIQTWLKQQTIRSYMKDHGLCVFIANGSILPRREDTDEPLAGAVLFQSPKELSVTIPMPDDTVMEGMGIPAGVTVITGGGYSGKSTLLDAIEQGIYHHIPGDGREYVLTDPSAMRTDAEDGRPVSNTDISPFFRFLPGRKVEDFSTAHASGSVSQAANIVEAVCAQAKLLLIDEDKSAANFMIRDRNMRLIVPNEPIIPFTDRVRELYQSRGISTILVIGSSSEYLAYADRVLLMEDYLPRVITKEVQNLPLAAFKAAIKEASWTESRRLIPRETGQEFLYVRHVKTENEKKIILDDYVADITHLTAIINENQMNLLAALCERLLCREDTDEEELLTLAKEYIDKAFDTHEETESVFLAAQLFSEEIRPMELYACLNRMRGLHFLKGGAACCPE